MTAPVQHPMYIDGQFVVGRGDAGSMYSTRQRKRCFPVSPMVRLTMPGGLLRRQSVRASLEALPAIERAGWLRKIAAGIRQRAQEIAALIVAEGAKSSSWRRWRSHLPPIILTIWPSGRVVMKAKSSRAIGRGKYPRLQTRAGRHHRNSAVELPVLPHRPQAGASANYRQHHRH